MKKMKQLHLEKTSTGIRVWIYGKNNFLKREYNISESSFSRLRRKAKRIIETGAITHFIF